MESEIMKNEIIIQCGTTYQTLTIALSLIEQQLKCKDSFVHIITTFEAMPSIRMTLEEFFPNYIEKEHFLLYGDMVSGDGNLIHQSEYRSNLNVILQKIVRKQSIEEIIYILASGTNWMNFHSGEILGALNHKIPLNVWYVYTLFHLEHGSFFPEKVGYFMDNNGKYIDTKTANQKELKGKPITALRPINMEFDFHDEYESVQPNQDRKELIIECGIDYEPLIIGISLLSQKLNAQIDYIHILTTREAREQIEFSMQKHLPGLEEGHHFSIYADNISGDGSSIDQLNYSKTMYKIIENYRLYQSKHSLKFIIASGRSWMTFLTGIVKGDSKVLLEQWLVWTAPELEDDSFFPQDEIFYEEDGKLVPIDINKEGRKEINGKPLTALIQIGQHSEYYSLTIENNVLNFLGDTIKLTNQQAAFYAYMLENSGEMNMLDSDFITSFNSYCLENQFYNKEKTLLSIEYEIDNVRSFVSNINKRILQLNKEIINHNLILEIVDIQRGSVASPLRDVDRLMLLDLKILK
jgi:hypothetical protein